MKLYAISYFDWFDHELTTRFAEHESELAALRAELTRLNLDIAPTIEACKQLAFDYNCMIHAAEVPNAK